MAATESRVHEIDGLRGIAILAVVVFHLLIAHLHKFIPGIELKKGVTLLAYGVDLFFVISGFLIGTILLKIESLSGIAAFYIRRIVRIWPLYYFLLFVVYAAVPAKNLLAQVPYWSFPLFIFNFWESAGNWVHAALGPLWSVAVEEQFYILGPILFWILNRKQISIVLLSVLVLSPLLRLILLYNTNLDLWKFTPTRMDGIVTGLLLSLFLSSAANVSFVAKRLKFFKRLMVLLLIAIPPAQFLLPDYLWNSFGYSLVALAFGCVLLVVQVQASLCERAPLLNSGFLRYFGLRCYSIYLFHIFINLIAAAISENTFAQLAIELTLIPLFAHLSWRYIEMPLLNFGRKFSYRKSNKLGQATA